MPRLILTIALVLTGLPGLASAQQIQFGAGWNEQKFSLFGSNDYSMGGETLGVRSDGTVSLLWTRLPDAMWDGRTARWDWAVERSVPGTDLRRKGGDDRNLSLYFLFLPDGAAEAARGQNVRSLLSNDDVRVLIYVWGGDHAPGAVLPSPYMGARGRSIIRQSAGTGSASERVDLAGDYERAFGGAPENLVGIAVSSDSDDTDSEVVGRISRLRIE